MNAKFTLTVSFNAEIFDGNEMAEKIKKYHDCPPMIDYTLKKLLMIALNHGINYSLVNVYLDGTKSKIELNQKSKVNEKNQFDFGLNEN